MIVRTALTYMGPVDIQTRIPLSDLRPGDRVLGLPDLFDPAAPRTVYVVAAGLGMHHVPSEQPTRTEEFLRKVGLSRLVAGAKEEGILVQDAYGPAMFCLDETPELDRVEL